MKAKDWVVLVMMTLWLAGCGGGNPANWDYDASGDALDYAEVQEMPTLTPCQEDILHDVPPEFSRCPSLTARPPTPTSIFQATKEALTFAPAVVTARGLNVRAGPSAESADIGDLHRCDVVQVTGESGEWLQIEYNGGRAYVHGDYVALGTSECGAITGEAEPVAQPPPVVIAPTNAPVQSGNCDPAYPTLCLPPPPPDLDCGQIAARRFDVLPPDPHNLDSDGDGVGCEN